LEFVLAVSGTPRYSLAFYSEAVFRARAWRPMHLIRRPYSERERGDQCILFGGRIQSESVETNAFYSEAAFRARAWRPVHFIGGRIQSESVENNAFYSKAVFRSIACFVSTMRDCICSYRSYDPDWLKIMVKCCLS
jgi:hypothetical protein